MHNLKLALDWTPNINHIGFFVAQAMGFYKDCGVHLEITDPSVDNYGTTPAKKVELGQVDFALCPMESVVSYRTKSAPFELTAIATVLQYDLSAIVCKDDGTNLSPKDLNGKSYASFQARYEDLIVKQLIKNDGGAGDLQIAYPHKLGIWQTIINNTYDATWVFTNWEGCDVNIMNQPLLYFKLSDYNVPYCYSPVIVANNTLLKSKAKSYTSFLAATKQGYLHAIANPTDAVKLLKTVIPESNSGIDLEKSMLLSAPAFGNAKNWGMMQVETVQSFMDWIYANNLETKPLQTTDLFTNSLLVGI